MNHFFFLLYAAWQHFVLPQVRCRGHIVQALVATLPVIKYLDVIKNGFAGFFPGLESSQVDHFVLDGAEKRFCTGIVVAVTLTAHAANNTVLGKQSLVIPAAVLNPTV